MQKYFEIRYLPLTILLLHYRGQNYHRISDLH